MRHCLERIRDIKLTGDLYYDFLLCLSKLVNIVSIKLCFRLYPYFRIAWALDFDIVLSGDESDHLQCKQNSANEDHLQAHSTVRLQ